MKKDSESLERRLEKQLLSILEGIPGIGGEARVSRNPAESDRAFDLRGEFQVPRTEDKIELWVKCRDLPRPSQFPFVNLTNRFPREGPRETRVPVLAAPHISPRMAELCEDHGWSWYDLAGNCRLVAPGSLYIERTGNKPVHERPKPKANLGTTASARVLRTLLMEEPVDRRWTQTELRDACDPSVSIGLVNKVVTHLREEAWLTLQEDGRFFVSDPAGLLQMWAKEYRFDHHRQISYFTRLKGKALTQMLSDLRLSDGKAAYAVFSAAEIDAPNVRQNKVWLYVNEAALDDLEKIIGSKQVDSGANLIVLVPDDDGVFYKRRPEEPWSLGRTNPIQTWLDLKNVGGRGEEAAEALMEQCLESKWKGVAHV